MKPNERLKSYKALLKVKAYEPECLTDYLYNHYTCEDITEGYRHTFHYQTLMEAAKAYHHASPKTSPVFLKVKRDEKSGHLYESEDFDDENHIYVFIDKESGFFETPNFELSYELTLEKGVSQEDYDHDTLVLLDALACIDDFMRINMIGAYASHL